MASADDDDANATKASCKSESSLSSFTNNTTTALLAHGNCFNVNGRNNASSSSFSLSCWKEHAHLNPVLTFCEDDTLLVPSQHVQSVLKHPVVQPWLEAAGAALSTITIHLTTLDDDKRKEKQPAIQVQLQKKIRLVQPYNETHQVLLIKQWLSPQSQSQPSPHGGAAGGTALLFDEIMAQRGPLQYNLQLDPSYFSAGDIFKILGIPPLDATTIGTSGTYRSGTTSSKTTDEQHLSVFDQVGHVLRIKAPLREEHEAYKYIIGDVLLFSFSPKVRTVVVRRPKRRQVQIASSNDDADDAEESRTLLVDDDCEYELEVLAGAANDTMVTVVESGVSLSFDLKHVPYYEYWDNPKACGAGERERNYLLQHEVHNGQTIVHVFAGVGILIQSLLVATKLPNCHVYAHDANPHAIGALEKAVMATTVAHRGHRKANNRSSKNRDLRDRIHTSCGDPYEFLVDMGLEWTTMPHHVVMNHPHEAASSLNALRWWKVPKRQHADTAGTSTFHVYTIATCPYSGDARGGGGDGRRRRRRRKATDDQQEEQDLLLQSAIDLVAHNLLPEGMDPTPNRTLHLNELGCNVKARVVGRDDGAAMERPGEGDIVVCVSFKATAQLLRHMQGEFV